MFFKKTSPLVLAVVLASFSSASAITDADIAPAALVGRTLKFTIENGGAPYATTGTWSGIFASSGNGFTATRVSGDFVNISTTYTAAVDGSYTNISLAKFIEGQKPATLTLYTASGVGRYEVSISDVFGVSLNGTFTIGAAAVTGPEISVRQGNSAELTDGSASKRDIGGALVGKSVSKIFTIKNSGNAALKNLSITTDGKNKAEFTVSKISKTTLAPKQNIDFIVTFKPKSIGVKNAAIHIKSNDKDESSFDIKITGTGRGIK